jgi:hypothetical protein
MHSGVPAQDGHRGVTARVSNVEMSSIADTQPRTGRRNFTLRAYLAGTAATAALLGAVVLVFASLGAYVAFNGLPIGGDQAASDPTSIEVGAAAQQTDTKAAGRHQQIANATVHRQNAGAASGSHAANTGSNAGGGSTGSQATPTPASPATPAGTSTATVSANGSGTTVATGPGQESPSGGGDPSSPLPTPHVTTPDSLGSTLGTVEQTLHQAGVDVPLNQAGPTVDQVTDGLLGGD